MNIEFLIGLVPWIVIFWAIIRLATLLWGDVVIPRRADMSQPERDAIRQRFEEQSTQRIQILSQERLDAQQAIDRSVQASREFSGMLVNRGHKENACRYCGMPLERSICTHCGAPTDNIHTRDPRLVVPEYTIRN